jgi:hypothetical protein
MMAITSADLRKKRDEVAERLKVRLKKFQRATSHKTKF